VTFAILKREQKRDDVCLSSTTFSMRVIHVDFLFFLSATEFKEVGKGKEKKKKKRTIKNGMNDHITIIGYNQIHLIIFHI
jgi:hypothetical protein